jgi:Flp pilus assembly protein TadG
LGRIATVTRIALRIRNIYCSEEGVVAIQIAIMMPMLIGIGALAIDVGFVLDKQRQMQSAADAAAFSAAIAKSTGHPTPISSEAYAVSGANGFVNGSNGVTVTVNNPPVNPPASAADAAKATAVQVIIQQPQKLPLVTAFCSLVGGACSGTFDVGAQAVVTVGSGTACALQLNSGVTPGVTIGNGATVNLSTCGLGVNSTGGNALSMSGGAQLDLSSGQPVSVVGGASITNGAAINPSTALATSQSAIADPYAKVVMPTASGCTYNNQQYGTPKPTMSPGTYCNVSFSYGTVTMNPGVYIINQGNFSVGGGVTLTGAGVTIVLTGSSGAYATLTISNGVSVTLSAPTTGATAGIVFFGDRSAPVSNTDSLTGGTTMNITGAFYFPTQTVSFAGGANNPSGCTQLIAAVIQFQGGANFSNNCPGVGTTAIGGVTALVE